MPIEHKNAGNFPDCYISRPLWQHKIVRKSLFTGNQFNSRTFLYPGKNNTFFFNNVNPSYFVYCF